MKFNGNTYGTMYGQQSEHLRLFGEFLSCPTVCPKTEAPKLRMTLHTITRWALKWGIIRQTLWTTRVWADDRCQLQPKGISLDWQTKNTNLGQTSFVSAHLVMLIEWQKLQRLPQNVEIIFVQKLKHKKVLSANFLHKVELNIAKHFEKEFTAGRFLSASLLACYRFSYADSSSVVYFFSPSPIGFFLPVLLCFLVCFGVVCKYFNIHSKEMKDSALWKWM